MVVTVLTAMTNDASNKVSSPERQSRHKSFIANGKFIQLATLGEVSRESSGSIIPDEI